MNINPSVVLFIAFHSSCFYAVNFLFININFRFYFLGYDFFRLFLYLLLSDLPKSKMDPKLIDNACFYLCSTTRSGEGVLADQLEAGHGLRDPRGGPDGGRT